MDFGRLDSIEGVDFELPVEPGRTSALLEASSVAAAPTLFLGTPRWSDPGFVGTIFPSGARPAEYLTHYGRQFATIELNTTYYGARRDHVERWAGSVPADFRFCPKLPKTVSHDLQLVNAREAMAAFVDHISPLASQLGPTWALLPPGFGPERFAQLVDFVAEWAGRLPLAIELRHPGWFTEGAERDVSDLFRRHGVIWIMTDVAGRRDVLHMHLTTPTHVLRFVGNRLHPTDFARIDAWCERLRDWFQRGLEQAFVFLHQPEEGLNLDIAEHIVRRFEGAPVVLRGPKRVEEASQTELF